MLRYVHYWPRRSLRCFGVSTCATVSQIVKPISASLTSWAGAARDPPRTSRPCVGEEPRLVLRGEIYRVPKHGNDVMSCVSLVGVSCNDVF